MAKILVLDDEVDILELVKMSLEHSGHTVLLAFDGLMALDLADRHRPDAVIADIMMPEMDGYEFCQNLRANPKIGKVPILILTARSPEEASEMAFKAGANGFLTKPFDPLALHGSVVKLLGQDGNEPPMLAGMQEISRRLDEKFASGGRSAEKTEETAVATMVRDVASSFAGTSSFAPAPLDTPKPTGATEDSADDAGALRALLRELVGLGGSDLHVKAGSPPGFRIHGELEPMARPPLTATETEELILGALTVEQREAFLAQDELDFALSIAGLARFRVNVFRQRGSVAAVARVIPIRVKTLAELSMPPVVAELASRPRGLVLVTGPTGSGKSTTLAAMVDHVNRNRRCHILTMEDPIEFLHADQKAFVNQREVGQDTRSFQEGLKRALRQDPDVIYVGEMRDLETISAAVSAAETGHLVFGTLHTTGAAATVDRIVDVFPAGQQSQIRMQLSAGLEGVVSQILLPRADGKGRAAALEVLVATPAIRNLIREGKTHQIASQMQGGGAKGMNPLNASLRALVRSGTVTLEAAVAVSPDPAELRALAV